MRRILIIAALCLLLPARAWAEPVTAQVDTTRTSMDKGVVLTITLEGVDGDPDLSPLVDFTIVNSGYMTSVRIINGSMIKSQTRQYRLLPIRSGELVIPTLTVETSSGDFHTDPITILVSGDGTAAPEPQTRPSVSRPQPGNPAGPVDKASPEYLVRGKEIAILPRVSNPNPVVGQPIDYTLEIYVTGRVANAKLVPPPFDGFTAQQLGEDKDRREILDGRVFAVFQRTYTLTPVEAGPHAIAPAVVNYDLIHGDLLRRSLEASSAQSATVDVDVAELPPYEGEGAFSGLLGTFELSANLERAELPAGESATLSLTLRGNGNFLGAPAPKLTLPPEIKSYEDTPEDDLRGSDLGYTGTRIYRYALVPTKPGEYDLEPVRIVYFDLQAREYKVLETKPLHITAGEPAQAEESVAAAAPSEAQAVEAGKQEVEVLHQDILPLREDMEGARDRTPMSPAWFAGLFLLPPLVYVLLLGWRRMRCREKDFVKVQAAEADRFLKESAAAAGRHDDESALSLLRKALVAAVCARTGRRTESLTYGEVESLGGLLPGNRRGPDAPEVLGLMRRLDSLRYGGKQASGEALVTLSKEVRQAVRRLCS